MRRPASLPVVWQRKRHAVRVEANLSQALARSRWLAVLLLAASGGLLLLGASVGSTG